MISLTVRSSSFELKFANLARVNYPRLYLLGLLLRSLKQLSNQVDAVDDGSRWL